MKKFIVGLLNCLLISCSTYTAEYAIEQYVNKRNAGIVIKQPEDQKLMGLRKQLADVRILEPQKACQLDPTIIMYPLLMHERLGVCYDYAMVQTFRKHGIRDTFEVAGCQDWIQILPFFKHVKKCKKNDLVIYIKNIIDKNTGPKQVICHFALIQNRYTLRTISKWGTIKAVYENDLFHLPDVWGDEVIIMRLEKEYRTAGKQQQIFTDHIRKIMQDDITVRQALFNYNRKLRELVDVFKKQTKKYSIIQLLEQQPHVSLNCRNELRKTPLILATIKNNDIVVQLLLEYGANKTLKDMYGKAALDYAIQNGNQVLQDMLQ
jgi:hypothetical protein